MSSFKEGVSTWGRTLDEIWVEYAASHDRHGPILENTPKTIKVKRGIEIRSLRQREQRFQEMMTRLLSESLK